ncbi:hypothetical protein BDA96_06G220000 [Sorghum bicolor]|uniref:Uncharacterized protein n=2 Tax=Sorghum bicolor TaxID=4558 RepID=A0A921QSD9_SORBI|nr:uncharacterized protein LOC8063909 isoform X2 [Sorghum bicolor]KAG0527279.1 hypothetical protein BDA96_06G220000 [Sorghum bicolor]KXG27031.1 hypothetical protein SORBI_3006G201300 [Sorghum bicolor]|eukprot:XP_021318675.1 uncharacterized protein LOC8063909 isoform X2 [Sorghum bicolor]
MDFLALPRRDLQALCKRNGVRANMTNAAMADALRALPKVDGIQEYVKQPVPVPEPEVEAVVEEQNMGKQGSLLPRGRRAVAKSSDPIETEEDNEEGKGHAKRQSSKEDAQAVGVGRRGASRHARPVPVVPQPAEVAEEDSQGENLKREAKMDHAPAAVVGRRGASRRARPSPAVAAPAVESEVAGAEEEQREEKVEDPKREATMDDVLPALGVGRRGASRRARAAPSVAALAGKLVAEEEQRAPIPHGPRVKAKGTSTEPIRLDDSDDEEKEDAKPEEQEDAQILGVGRRGGASRRAQAAPAVAAPETNAEEEQRGPVPRGRRVKANSTELIRLDDSKEEKKQDTKPEEDKGDAPAIAAGRRGAGRRGAGRRAPAPSEAPAASKAEAGDVAVEAVPIRATRQRKPTMKAAAAAEEKAPRRATRRSAVMRIQEEPQGVFSDAEAVGAPEVAVEAVPIRATRHRKPTIKAAAAAAAKAEEKVPPRVTKRGTVMRTVLQPEVQEEPQEAVGAPVSYQRCDAQQEFEDVSYPQKQELSKDEDEDVVIIENEKLMEKAPAEESSVTDHECPDKSEIQEQVDDEKCHAPLAAQEESPIIGLVSMVTEQASEDDESANYQDGGGSSSGLLDKGVCEETYDAGEEMEHMDIAELQADIVDEAAFLDCSGNISQVAGEETNEEVNTEDGISCREEGDVVADKVLHDSVDNTILLDCSSDISWVEVEKAGNITSEMPDNQAAVGEDGDEPNGVVIGDSMSQATVKDEVAQEEKGVLITDEILQGTAGMHDMEDDQFETVFDQADQVVTADNLPEQVTDCEITVEVITLLIVDERQQSTVTIDENVIEDHSETDGVHSNEQIEVVTTDKVPELKLIEDVLVQADQVVTDDNLPEQVTDCEITVEENTGLIVPELTGTNVEVIEEKTSAGVDEQQKSTVTLDTDVVDDHFKTDFVHADEQMEVELTDTDDEVVEEMKTPLVVDEKQQSTVTDNGDFVDDLFKTHGAHADEQKEVVDEKKQSTITMDGDVVFDHLKTDTAHADEQEEVIGIVSELPDEVTGTDDEVIEEKTVVITEDMPNQGTVPNITHTMDECLKENNFGTDFDHGNEQKKAITADIEPEVSWAQDGAGVWKENALLDDVTESLSKSIVTMEPSVCKNCSEKNPAEPMAVLEEKGVKVASESEDLTKLSLGQLRAKLKEKLNAKKNKEAKKRVALARVDENVCRSHAKGQQQNLNLQQH